MTRHLDNANTGKTEIYRRYTNALIMYDLIHECDTSAIMKRFKIDYSSIQKLQTDVSYFSGSFPTFCRMMGYVNLHLLFTGYQYRIDLAVKTELIELMNIPRMKSKEARCLYEGKIRRPEDIVILLF